MGPETSSYRLATAPAELQRLIDDQAHLLLAVAGGLPRTADLDGEYRARARELDHGLRAFGMRDPFPYRDLAAWVGECRLRWPDDVAQRRAHVVALAAQHRAALTSLADQQAARPAGL